MNIVLKNIDDIKEYENNPRFNDNAVEAVKNSIEDYGFLNPIIVDSDGVIICGHTRCKAAKELGMEQVPVVVADDLTPEQVKAYRLADNKVGEFSTWDEEKLNEELSKVENDSHLQSMFEKLESRELPSGEIDLGSFDDEVFEHECQNCGFKF